MDVDLLVGRRGNLLSLQGSDSQGRQVRFKARQESGTSKLQTQQTHRCTRNSANELVQRGWLHQLNPSAQFSALVEAIHSHSICTCIGGHTLPLAASALLNHLRNLHQNTGQSKNQRGTAKFDSTRVKSLQSAFSQATKFLLGSAKKRQRQYAVGA